LRMKKSIELNSLPCKLWEKQGLCLVGYTDPPLGVQRL
jgi:hypothetical protein